MSIIFDTVTERVNKIVCINITSSSINVKDILMQTMVKTLLDTYTVKQKYILLQSNMHIITA